MVTTDTMLTVKKMAQAADSVKAEDITAIDVSERLPLADVFLILSGTSERHVNGIVDAVEKEMLLGGIRPFHREGYCGGRWVLLEYEDIIVHVQHQEEREFYALGRLWSDSPKLVLEQGRVAAA